MRTANEVSKMEKTTSGNAPEKKFSTGAISATVWKNSGKSKTGQDVEYKTVTLQRRYKDKKDEWQSTNSLRINDLPKAALVLNKAYEYLVLRDTTIVSSEEEDIFEE
ncbi:MAG: hypothetical protein KKA79_03850, partial [Nanoarchaeota archaeon]|nr:hypothetical protein [Nanoarchaeota archaeon]